MYYAYAIKIYFTNGDWAYPKFEGGGRYGFTKSANSTMYFDTVQEAKDYYYQHLRGGTMDNGLQVDWGRCSIIKVESNGPI